ncbi:MAG: tetratricopeptide repeat protein [Planctomycetota bacterium]|nr:tetratricopeptide repeat protein [Planctomycetota bacterium]
MRKLRYAGPFLGVLVLLGCASTSTTTSSYSPGEMGDHSYQQGDLDGAIHHYTNHLKGDPGDAARRYCLGIALERNAQLEEARMQFEQVLQARPASPEVQLALSHVLYRMDNDVEAEEMLGRVMVTPEFSTISPLDRVLAYGLLAQIAIRTEDPEAATLALDRALALSREYPAHVTDGHLRRLLNNRAMVLFGLGEFTEARDSYEKAIQVKVEAGAARSDSENYMACYLNYLARDFPRCREYFDQLADQQLASLGTTTEDPEFFSRNSDTSGVSSR